MVMNSKLYDFLKKCGKRYLPIFTIIILAIGHFCQIPHTEEVSIIILIFTLFLNEYINISKKKFKIFEAAHYEQDKEF